MELFVYYILPNIVLFSGIYAVAKAAEHSAWYVIENYNSFMQRLDNNPIDNSKP